MSDEPNQADQANRTANEAETGQTQPSGETQQSETTQSTAPAGQSQQTQPEFTPPAKPKKPRSSVERAVVWGAIGILLVVAAIQGMAAWGFTQSKKKVVDALEQAESSGQDESLHLEGAEKLLRGFWTKSELKQAGTHQYVVYMWPGIYTDYRLLLNVSVDEQNPIVMSYQMNTDVSEHSALIAESRPEGPDPESDLDQSGNGDSEGDESASSDEGDGESGEDGDGQRRRGPIDWAALDADGDNKISREEAPEFMQRFFDRIDTNGDGFIDEAEREESRRRREARRNESRSDQPPVGAPTGDRGAGDSSSDRPRRPDGSDDSRDSGSSDEPGGSNGASDADTASDRSPASD